MQQRRDIVRQLQCKAGKDQIRIGGRESLGIFSAVGPVEGAGGGRISVTSRSEISARAENVFPNAIQELRGKIFLILVLLTVDYRGRIRRERWQAGVQTQLLGRVSF